MGIFNVRPSIHKYSNYTKYTQHIHIIYVGTKQTKLLIFEGSVEVKLPTIWRDEKQSREEAERRERLEERRVEEKE